MLDEKESSYSDANWRHPVPVPGKNKQKYTFCTEKSEQHEMVACYCSVQLIVTA